MLRVARPPTFSDRTLNRLLLACGLSLLIGIPLFAVFYWSDRHVDAGPSMVDRQIAQFEAAVRQKPDDIPVRLQLAGAYTAAQRYGDAIAQYDQVLKGKPDYKSALLGRGQAYQLERNAPSAVSDFQKVIDLAKGGEFANEDTELAQAYYGLGQIDLQAGRAGDAIPLLQGALKITQTDSDTLDLLGQAYLQTGQSAKAIEALRGAVLFVPVGWADPYRTLATAYKAAAQPEEAAWASAMAMLADKRTAEAVASLKALTTGPARADAMVGLGLAMEATGDLPAAASWYRQALGVRPGDMTAQIGLSRAAPQSSNAVPVHPSLPPAASAPAGNS
ncbi:MAG TPA: tetratricopeptide repeat protein [Candidatus Limnocylindrales bacterium]